MSGGQRDAVLEVQSTLAHRLRASRAKRGSNRVGLDRSPSEQSGLSGPPIEGLCRSSAGGRGSSGVTMDNETPDGPRDTDPADEVGRGSGGMLLLCKHLLASATTSPHGV